MADRSVEQSAEPPLEDAYSLLSRPTLSINDAQAELIVADLRKRREAYLKTGKPDKPKKETGPARPKPTKEDKAAATKALLAGLDLKMPGEK